MTKPLKVFVVGPLRATIHEVKRKRSDREVTTHTTRIQLKSKGENGDEKQSFWTSYGLFIEIVVRQVIDFMIRRECEQERKRTASTPRHEC